MHLTAFLPSLILALATTTVAAEEWGPDLGSTMPADLSATTQDGTTVALSEIGNDNGLVVAFVRSADWCPFCKRQLVDLSGRSGDFEKRGYAVASISYDSADILKSFDEQFEITFDLLSDPDSQIIDAFGIRNEDQKPGTAGDGIPHPGIMVFDANGSLVAKFAEKSYRKRPKIDDVLATIDGFE